MLGNQLAVDSIPVNVFFIPILSFLLAEKDSKGGGVGSYDWRRDDAFKSCVAVWQ